MNKTSKELTRIIAHVIQKETNELGDLSGKELFEDLNFDSITIMELILEIEKEFDIEFHEDELIDAISSFNTLVDMIEEHCN